MNHAQNAASERHRRASERMSGMCDACIEKYPEEFEERYAAAEESYTERPVYHQ